MQLRTHLAWTLAAVAAWTAHGGVWALPAGEPAVLLAETEAAAMVLAEAGAAVGVTLETPFLDDAGNHLAVEIVAAAGAGAGAGAAFSFEDLLPGELFAGDGIGLYELPDVDWGEWLRELPLELSAEAFAFAEAFASFSVAVQQSHDCAPVPEPSAALAFGVAFAGVWAYRRRRVAGMMPA